MTAAAPYVDDEQVQAARRGPRTRRPRRMGLARAERRRAALRGGRARRPLVLLIEDHEATREMYDIGLRFAGFDVVAMEHGRAALVQALALRPDLIVLDLMLPGVDGWTVLARLRTHPSTAPTPVIIVTAHELAALLGAAAKAAGADLLLPKPCTPAQLATHIRRILQQRAS